MAGGLTYTEPIDLRQRAALLGDEGAYGVQHGDAGVGAHKATVIALPQETTALSILVEGGLFTYDGTTGDPDAAMADPASTDWSAPLQLGDLVFSPGPTALTAIRVTRTTGGDLRVAARAKPLVSRRAA